MITFSRLGSYGAMGNQLFQYAALFGLSRKTGFEMKIPKPSNNVDGRLKVIGRYNNESKNPIEKYDLDGWITFTPWRDSTNIFEPDPPNPLTRYKREYLKSIGKGHIPPLKHELNLHTSNTTRGAVALLLANIDDDITLLPSQQCKDKLSLQCFFKRRGWL